MKRLTLLLLSFFSASFVGCNVAPHADQRLASAGTGKVMGGQQPVSGATIQLYAVGTGGDGSASTALLSRTVTTDSGGNFSITGLYTCASPGTLTYLTATGGNPGLGTGVTNPQSVLMAALGRCDSLSPGTFIIMDEVTTIASVSALAPFASSTTAIGSATGDASALRDAFTAASQFANYATGTAPGTNVPPGNTVPTARINSLANILSACINTAGGTAGDTSACGQFFSLTTPASAAAPSNTFTALLNLANNPTLNTPTLFNLAPASAPFQPQLTSAPPDYGIRLTGPTTLQFSASSLNYPTTPVSSSAPSQSVTLTNTGNSQIAVSSIVATGTSPADFPETNTCPASLAPQATCTISTGFTPTAAGARYGYVVVTSNAGNSPQSIALSGVATSSSASLNLSPGSIAFPATTVGFPASAQVTISNNGGAAASFGSITVSNTADFSQTNNCPASLASNASCQVNIIFTPSALGTRMGSLTVTSNAVNPSASVSLSGAGAAGTAGPLGLSTTALVSADFATAAFTLTNQGTSTLSIASITENSPSFTFTTNCGSTLTAGASCIVAETPAPTVSNLTAGRFTITSNSAASPQYVSINQNLDSVQFLGTTVVGNASPIPGGYTGIYPENGTFSGPNASDFYFTGANCKAGAACSGPIAFKPTGTGERVAVVNYTGQYAFSYVLDGFGSATAGPSQALCPARPCLLRNTARCSKAERSGTPAPRRSPSVGVRA